LSTIPVLLKVFYQLQSVTRASFPRSRWSFRSEYININWHRTIHKKYLKVLIDMQLTDAYPFIPKKGVSNWLALRPIPAKLSTDSSFYKTKIVAW